MKISIVTISYNQAPFLEQAIHSIQKQDFDGLEYIMVDPGSSDGSREIIERYRGGMAAVLYDPDRGPADGLNNGFAAATGSVFGYINADDALLPGALHKVAAYFECHPHVDIVCGCGYTIDAGGGRLARKIPTRMSARLNAYGAVTFFQQGIFFRADAFREAGGFNLENRTCWDAELILDMLLNGKRTGILHEDLALFRIHDTSISGSGRLRQMYEQDCRRLFAKAMGRDMSGLDRLLGKLFLLEKWTMNPRATLERARVSLRGFK